jgi:hypothetical protein
MTDVPDWLAPPLPHYHPTVIHTRREIKAMQTQIEHLTFESLFDEALDRIAAGQPLIQTIEGDPREPNYTRMLAWIHADPQREAQYHEAQKIGAEVIAQQLLALSDASDSMEDVNRSTLRINTRKWLLGVWNRKRFGDVKQIDQNVTIDLSGAMQQAQERLDRSRTVDADVRRIE